ncbi:hypothetical protein K438DRAFT_1765837 [Mycena galopus ATCC 62051]|nr:hypothetical protein K438DRAFT_1765837 [Mycena galopus ATCC 62051]
MSKNELLEASKRLRQNLGLANQHIVARDGIIESSHATIVLQNVFCERQSEALNAKEQKKKTNHVTLSMGSLGRHLTAPEWIAKTEEAQRLRDAENVAKVQRAEDREAAQMAKEALEERWKEMKAAHEKAVVTWEAECRDLRADQKISPKNRSDRKNRSPQWSMSLQQQETTMIRALRKSRRLWDGLESRLSRVAHLKGFCDIWVFVVNTK